ncbi:1,4-alpha-glucan branching protein GlgB [Anaerocolumna sedimenticola]|uniref:1,4-alpha-glucan branching enzyme GlgB n=1 Tax=Anaerocolumna sedimenticola TaxID=2696063 RepID=A0A6P1TQK4_9FIRM|nr:1,4-alpha-glucan branching protein GlgB [Anaerocolumna sedimenticola]
MEELLYDLLDWTEASKIIYSEHDNPHSLLGAHVTEKGILINAFIPTAVHIDVKITGSGQVYPMICKDKDGFFSVIVTGNKVIPYTLFVTYNNNSTEEIRDPYSFDPVIDPMDLTRFAGGIHYNIYDKLGAHMMEVDGVNGILFAVWAPNAVRVSVVGNFNNWDGRRHTMRRLYDSGIFELFIPNLRPGEIYKYEIKIKGGLIVLKADPYANQTELRPNNASIVCNLNEYEWQDGNWIQERAEKQYESEPMSVYEVHLGSWKKPPVDEGREFYNYRELAPMLAGYVKDMGYTHIELMPVMEHPFDGSWGYQVTGYYAPTARYGTPSDFMYFMDFMHRQGIGVILDWVPAHFPRDTFGLANFDGTCLYEHKDPRQGSHPHWGTLIYNYGRPQVSNFLIANALFWIEKYHADGIRMDAVASMLYLDYGKKAGQWVANIYGGNENLEAMELLKHLNSIFRKRKDGSLIIAEESTAWPKVTGDVKAGGLGFDLKWNLGWMNDFTNYMKCDPLFRKGRHGELTFSMIYAYSEKFMLVLSHDEVVHGKGSMINKMPGSIEQKFANLRVAYGFMMSHPGKKLLFMGQDFAQYAEWNEAKSLDWDLLNEDQNCKLNRYVRDWNKLYRSYPAFYQLDYDENGFEWISCMDADHSIIVFIRKTSIIEETMLVVCNFTPVVYKNFLIGVPFTGKYKEIFNSDKTIYGGSGNMNPRQKQSRKVESDGRDQSISLTVPPLGIAVFTCTPVITN